MTISKTVSYICNNCAFRPFDCERKNWCEEQFRPRRRLTKDESCPLMQFDAKEDTDKRPFFEKLKDGLTEETPESHDMWKVCAICKYSSTSGNEISLKDCYNDHCIDCPLNSVREGMQECDAEAIMS